MLGFFILVSCLDIYVGQVLYDGVECVGEGWVVDFEVFDGEVDFIDQVVFVEGVFVGQFQFDVFDQEFQFGVLFFVQWWLLFQLFVQGGQFVQQIFFWYGIFFDV